MTTHDDYMTQRQARDLARRLARLERKTRSTAAAHADLRHSAIDGGKGLVLKDEQGQERYRLGTDENGVTAPQYKGGPAPEQPSEPFVDVGGEVVKVQHSGLDVDENPAPTDFRRAQIHVSQDEVFEPDFSTLAGYLEEADGSFTHRLPGGEWWVGIVWETLSGKISVMSGTVLADIPPLVDTSDLEDTLAEAEQIIADAVAAAQVELDELRDRLDNFEGFDPSDLIAQINQVTEDLAAARQEAAGLVADLGERVDNIKIPDVSEFITQAEVDAAAAAAETAAKEHADLVAQGAKDDAIAEAETKANAAQAAAEAAAKAYTDQQDATVKAEAAADAQTKADAAQAEAERLAAEHAELVATGAKDDAIAEAERLHALAVAEAEAAQSRADEAHANAGSAWDHADAALTRAETAETNAIAEAQAQLDALEIGSRNLILNSEFRKAPFRYNSDRYAEVDRGYNFFTYTTPTNVNAGPLFGFSVPLGLGQDYVLSFDVDVAEGHPLNLNYVRLRTAGSRFPPGGIGGQSLNVGVFAPGPHRVEIPFTSTSNAVGIWLGNNQSEEVEVTLSNLKLEKGSKATDWTPAPEDLEARIAQAQADAQTHADNLPKMLGGTTAPTGTAPNGSIWFRRDANNTVTGRWERINGSWVQQEVSGELIDNLEAGKITALHTEFAESVVGKLWTQLAIVDRLIATSAWIGGAMIGEDAVEAKHITASESLSAKVAEFLKLSVADLIAGSAEIDEAVVEKFWTAFAVIDRLSAAQAWVTGDLVVGETIRTRHLHVTREMVGEFASFMHLVTDRMDVNALWADTAWLTAVEAASVRLRSVINDWQTILSGRGMEVISPEGQPTVQLGNYEETGLTLYQDGEATASVTDDGHVSGTVVSANDEFYYQGTELSEHLNVDAMPKGILAHYESTLTRGRYYIETGIGYLQFLATPGRMYKITIDGMFRIDATSGAYIRLRAAHSGAPSTGWPTVTVNSGLVGEKILHLPSNYSNRGSTLTFYWTYPSPDMETLKPTRLLITMEPFSGAGVQMAAGTTFTLEDVGRVPDAGFFWDKGGSTGGTSPDPDPTPADPTPVRTRRVSTYNMSWWRTWWQNGNIPSYGVGVKEAAQGRSPYFTTAGTYRSMIGFPSMTSDLSGADIEKIEVRVRVTHSHAGSGGNVRLGTHSNTSRPSSYTGYSNAESTNTHFGRGQEKWVTLPSSLYNGFKNGTYRGVTMFTSSTSSTYYVQARPSRFAIRVTYRK